MDDSKGGFYNRRDEQWIDAIREALTSCVGRSIDDNDVVDWITESIDKAVSKVGTVNPGRHTPSNMIRLKNGIAGTGNPITLDAGDISSVSEMIDKESNVCSVVIMKSGVKYFVAQPYDEIVRLVDVRRNLVAMLDHPLIRKVLGDLEDGFGGHDLWATARSWMDVRDNLLDRVGFGAIPADSIQSSWIIIVHRAGSAQTVLLPGIGRVLRSGGYDADISFATWREAIECAERACDAYGCVTEVGRVDLVLGACE